MECKTLKIKSTHPASQGPFVEVNATDYDSATMELFEVPPPPPAPPAPVVPPPAPPDPLDALGANWRDGDVAEMRALAAAMSGRAVENKEQAIAVIEMALTLKAQG